MDALAVCPIFEKKREVCEYYGTKKSIVEVNKSPSLYLTERVRTFGGMSVLAGYVSGHGPAWSAINLAIASATRAGRQKFMSTDARIA